MLQKDSDPKSFSIGDGSSTASGMTYAVLRKANKELHEQDINSSSISQRVFKAEKISADSRPDRHDRY